MHGLNDDQSHPRVEFVFYIPFDLVISSDTPEQKYQSLLIILSFPRNNRFVVQFSKVCFFQIIELYD